MKAAIHQLLLYTTMYALLWLCDVHGQEGAGNLLALIVFLQVLITVAAIWAGIERRAVQDLPKGALPAFISNSLMFGLLVGLVWFGHWLMGIGWLFVSVMALGMRAERDKQREEQRQ
ncbi:MAG: hypothetical protein PBV86_12350 [Delftia lacustris]|jgi:preprotein translocase subunit SecY|uniref:hypothetical protein n=1 Tax=Delftia TaxID=80865 RepID=UPI00259D1A23|nr:hypothetical protein [Delftia sp.]